MSGKQFKAAQEKVDPEHKETSLETACSQLKDISFAKFDESVELHMALNIDPRHADQIVRGTLSLPHGTGKALKIVVIAAEGDLSSLDSSKVLEAGGDEIIEKIQKGWVDFDVLIVTPEMMKKIGKLGRVLGARGLMPSPKNGTVTKDISAAVDEFFAGKVEYRNDKNGNIHAVVGKLSFDNKKLEENIVAFCEAIKKAKPAKVKSPYVKSFTICSSMSPGIRLDEQIVLA